MFKFANSGINLNLIEGGYLNMVSFFKAYKKTRKVYNVLILVLSGLLLLEVGIIAYEGNIYFKYGSNELLKWFDYGNGDINFDGVTNDDDFSLLNNALSPNMNDDCVTFEQSGVNYLLQENIKGYLNVKEMDEYLLKRIRNRADCSKDNILDDADLSALDILIRKQRRGFYE